jgi:hypothetical protein
MDFFSRQADEFVFDKEKYLEAVAEVPVFTMTKPNLCDII